MPPISPVRRRQRRVIQALQWMETEGAAELLERLPVSRDAKAALRQRTRTAPLSGKP